MALSKVKKKKQEVRLAARIAEYTKQPSHRESGHQFTKPGSQRK